MRKADVVVIGGGLIGCAAAWRLAESGMAVTLLEAFELNAGASGQNAGSLHFQIERRFLEQGNRDGVLEAVAELNRAAVGDWRSIEAELGLDLHVTMKGGLMVAETHEQAAWLEEKARLERAAGLNVETLDGSAARAMAPYLDRRVVAANFASDEGHADPTSLVPALAKAAVSAGATILTRNPVRRIDRENGGYRVVSETTSLQAERLLIAAGAWTPRVCALVNLHVPLFPIGLQLHASERLDPRFPHLLQHVGRRLSLKQTHAGNVLIGGGHPARMARDGGGGFDPAVAPTINPEAMSANLRAAVDIVPELARASLIRSWTGVTAVTADQLPVAGTMPKRGIWVAAGGSGFTLGLTFARLIAAAMGGERAAELDALSPSRFDHLNSFMGASAG